MVKSQLLYQLSYLSVDESVTGFRAGGGCEVYSNLRIAQEEIIAEIEIFSEVQFRGVRKGFRG